MKALLSLIILVASSHSMPAEDAVNEVVVLFTNASHSIVFDHDALNYLTNLAGRAEKSEEFAKEAATNVKAGLTRCLRVTTAYFHQKQIDVSLPTPKKILTGYALVISQSEALLAVLADKSQDNNQRLIEAAKAASTFIHSEIISVKLAN